MVKELVDIDLQKNSSEQVCDPKINCHSLVNGSNDCSYQHWRNALENICQSLCPTEGVGGGIADCIREALLSSAGSSHANVAKVYCRSPFSFFSFHSRFAHCFIL